MGDREGYEFGEFRLEPAERRLTRGGVNAVVLPPKTYDVLVALVQRAGELITKRELLDAVWPDAFVEEGILAVHVSGLRKALGEGAIETVPRAGYRFRTPVLTGNGGPAAAARAAEPGAYEQFGRGRFHLLAASMFEIPKAVAAFRAAAELDPQYAPAHAGLALARCAEACYRLATPAEAYSEARAAALRALALDGMSADAQLALGTVMFFAEWNWSGAERSLARALEIDPHLSEAWLAYGQLLDALGRLEAGLASKRRALERDPFSALAHLQISLSYWNQRRYDDAIEWASRALEIDPRHPHAREHLAAAYLKKGDEERYVAENLKHAELHGAPAEMLDQLRRVFAAGGHRAIVRMVLDRAARQPEAFPAMQLALFHGEAGEMDAAFAALARAIDAHEPALVHLAVAPQWDCLRGDRRFDTALARMGLPNLSNSAGLGR
jgi:DNA-binding winged helix-turn-helix (wHTH) protein/Flp pilus assembly protein TadD